MLSKFQVQKIEAGYSLFLGGSLVSSSVTLLNTPCRHLPRRFCHACLVWVLDALLSEATHIMQEFGTFLQF